MYLVLIKQENNFQVQLIFVFEKRINGFLASKSSHFNKQRRFMSDGCFLFSTIPMLTSLALL